MRHIQGFKFDLWRSVYVSQFFGEIEVGGSRAGD
jgi:hypothetical protein